MAINEQWIPIIGECVSWIRETIGPSKKELKMQVSDLEKQVKNLLNGNTVLANNYSLITQAILKQLKTEKNFSVSADTIIFVGENNGVLDVVNPVISESFISGNIVAKKQVGQTYVSKIFEGIDEEILEIKNSKPSDRRR